MAIYETHFNEYTLGVTPSDWTDRWVTTNWTHTVEAGTGGEGPRLDIDSGLDARYLLTWDDVDADANRADSEVLVRISAASTVSDNFYFGLAIRASGSAAAETGYACYLFDGNYYLIRYDAGASSVIGNVVGGPRSELGEEWYWMRLRVNGTSIRARAWRESAEEPTTWPLDVTNSDISAAGSIGVLASEANTPDMYVDYIGIGTNGDTVPIPIDATANIRSDQQFIHVAAALDPPPIRSDQQFIQVAAGLDAVPIRVDQQFIQVAHEYVPPPTSFVTDFSEYTTGAPPTGWTGRWATANVTWDIADSTLFDGGKYLTQSVHSADGRSLLSWDAVDDAVDIELLLRLKTSNGFDGYADFFTYLQARASGALGAENSYYVALFFTTYSMEMRLGKYVAGTSISLGTHVIDEEEYWDFVKNKVYLVRLSVVGTAVKAKVWPDATPEPAWQVEATDSDITTGGWAGIGEYTSDREIYYDYLSVGIEGNPAPLVTSLDTSEQLSQVLAEVAIVGDSPETRVTQVLAEVAVVSPYPEPPVVLQADFVVVSINT